MAISTEDGGVAVPLSPSTSRVRLLLHLPKRIQNDYDDAPSICTLPEPTVTHAAVTLASQIHLRAQLHRAQQNDPLVKQTSKALEILTSVQ